MLFAACYTKGSKTETDNMDYAKTTTTNSTSTAIVLIPSGSKPSWGEDMTDPMTVVIEKLISYKAQPLVDLSAKEARKQPSPADAVMDIMKENEIPIPITILDTVSKNISVSGGKIHLRIYSPKTGKDVYPVIVYYHGGGWVIATLDAYGASAERLAHQADAIVVSVAYRQAPEFKFPTAHNDSFAAYDWVVKNAASIKGDSKKIAVVGESAGGNLAAAVSMMAREKGIQLPIYQVLVYPIAGYDFNTVSYKENVEKAPLNAG
jgi:acetyl esterase/lipase